jgi:hypothetical protein
MLVLSYFRVEVSGAGEKNLRWDGKRRTNRKKVKTLKLFKLINGPFLE